MVSQTPDPESFLPLPPASFHILIVLARGENHGYAIMQQIDHDTEGCFRIGPGTLYGTIKRMMKSGWIEEADERPDPALDDERRRYYRLTDLGLRVTRAEARRLEGMVRLARQLNTSPHSPVISGGAL
ncbi:MAG: PadR family transcriptional regulator [Chloroflexota bacterium]|jgi:DNA-binding PadR family transcriptional regulator